jgi:uncharacterized RDD family membrane protein YckC
MTSSWISVVPREAQLYQGRRAGLVTRLVASALDAAVVAALVLVAYLGLAGATYLVHPRRFHLPAPSPAVRSLVILVILLAYLSLGWGTSGRTYGGQVMGLRVVTSRGERLRLVRALARAVVCAFFPIGLLWCAVSRTSRSVADLLLRTSVIYDWDPRAPWHRP